MMSLVKIKMSSIKCLAINIAAVSSLGLSAQVPSFEEVDKVLGTSLKGQRFHASGSGYEVKLDNTRGFQYGTVRFNRLIRRSSLPKYTCSNSGLDNCHINILRTSAPEAGYETFDRLFDDSIRLVPLIRLNSVISNYIKRGRIGAEQHCNLRVTENPHNGDAVVFVPTSKQRGVREQTLPIPGGIFEETFQELISSKIEVDHYENSIEVEAVLLAKRGSSAELENERSQGLLCRYKISPAGVVVTSERLKDVTLNYFHRTGSHNISAEQLEQDYSPFSEIEVRF